MTSVNHILDILDPLTIMTVGSCMAFSTALMLLVHVKNARNFRLSLVLLTASMTMAGFAMTFYVLQFGEGTLFYGHASSLLGCMSYLAAMSSLVLLYRPQFSHRTLLYIAAICIGGFAIFTNAIPTRNWSVICQFFISLLTAALLIRSTDALAPGLKWVTVALCLFSALGLSPGAISALTTPFDENMANMAIGTPTYRIRALMWAIMPSLIYACVTGVLHTRSAQKLKNSANMDVLTGAHSRRYLFEKGERLLQKEQVNSRHPPTVLLIDVDHFKKFNDTWGHAMGDNVLKHCVQCIRAAVRAQDALIVRYGGEEFCVLLPSIDPSSASALAERVRQQVASNPYRHGESALTITVSIGVAQQQGRDTLTALINLADERLYRAKHTGRNRVIDQGGMLVPV